MTIGRTTQFPVTGLADSPTIQDATWRFDRNDRAYIDGQIIGIQNVIARGSNGNALSIQGVPVDSAAPLSGQVLEFNGTKWAPASPSTVFTAGGDLSGTSSSQTVIGFKNVALDASMTAPSDNVFIQKLAGKWAAITAAVAAVALIAASVTNTPTTGQVLTATGTSTAAWQTPSTVASGVTPGSNGQIYITVGGISAWTSLISTDTTYGKFVAGGQGGNYKAIIGPYPGAEASFSSIHFLAPATTPTSGNYAFASDGSTLYGNAAASIIFSIATAQTVAVVPTGLTFVGTVATPTINQSIVASDIAPQNLKISAQAPFAAASVNLLPGHTVINIQSAVGAGNLLGGVDITYANNQMISMGTYGGVAGGSYGYTAIWFGGGAPGAGNYAFLGDRSQTSTYLNGGSNLYFAISGSVSAGHWRSTDLTLGSTAGSGPISFSFGTPAAPVMVFGFGGTGAVTAQIYTLAPSNDVAAANLYLGAQGPFASATVNRHPGQLTAQVPTPLGANDFYGGLLVQAASGPTPLVRVGHYGGPDVTYAAIYFMDAGTPSTTNFGFLGSQSFTYLNVAAAGSVVFSVNGSAASGIANAYSGAGAGTWTMIGGSGVGNFNVGTNVAAGITSLMGGTSVLCLSVAAPGSTAGTGTTTITGAQIHTVRKTGSNFTVDTTTTDRVFIINATSSDTLPTQSNGRRLTWFIDATAGAVTLTVIRHAAEKINGIAASFIITVAVGSIFRLELVSDGTDWWLA